MRWWPFSRQKKIISNKNEIKIDLQPTVRQRLDDLRQYCDTVQNTPESGRQRLREKMVEWEDEVKQEKMNKSQYEGLSRRARVLIRASDEEWGRRLVDEDFWMPGWRLDEGG